MQILVLNAGSTSLKYKLFDARTFKILKENYFQNLKNNHAKALKEAIHEIGNLTDIKACGHRIVHGGKEFRKAIMLDNNILKRISKYNNLAPLHNPYNLLIAKLSKIYLPDIVHVGCFDTSFFTGLPLRAKIYALPIKYYKKYGIERFGFHGISHKYVANAAAKILKRRLDRINLITCHLGGGSSITAISKGRAIDTSMGFTPMEGLVMMSRSGDIDPGLIFYLNKKYHFSLKKIYDLLNHKSGLKGLANVNNFLDLLKKIKLGDKKSKLAFEVFIYRIQKYIGAYFGILGKIDAVVFTGAIGSGDPYTRKRITKPLKFLKKTKILSIQTNEELAIAQEAKKFLRL